MKKYLWFAPMSAFLLWMFFSCSKSTKNENSGLMPYSQTEAKEIALCLSGELEAPENLSNRILWDLAVIRSTYGDEYEMIKGITFHPPWVEGCFIVAFDDTTYQKVATGEYHAWDELNAQYQVYRIDTAGFYGHALLYFEGNLHPGRLAELYSNLPGVNYAEPNGIDGDSPNLYARQTENGLTYLFRYAEGDCPVGCMHNEYWYFVFKWSRPVLVGHWVFDVKTPPPNWWNEAKLNRAQGCN
jgi:hypothetical protein